MIFYVTCETLESGTGWRAARTATTTTGTELCHECDCIRKSRRPQLQSSVFRLLRFMRQTMVVPATRHRPGLGDRCRS
eukprot:2699408-Pleurochrysis_carterae.AAC.1